MARCVERNHNFLIISAGNMMTIFSDSFSSLKRLILEGSVMLSILRPEGPVRREVLATVQRTAGSLAPASLRHAGGGDLVQGGWLVLQLSQRSQLAAGLKTYSLPWR